MVVIGAGGGGYDGVGKTGEGNEEAQPSNYKINHRGEVVISLYVGKW